LLATEGRFRQNREREAGLVELRAFPLVLVIAPCVPSLHGSISGLIAHGATIGT
jgi:hypothetical protein